MNSVNQFEDSGSRSRGKHEGESSNALCDRLSRTRDTSPRQLPTDHDHAVPTREYQTDQSSLKPAPAAAGPVFDQRQKQRQKQHHECAGVDRSLHIRANPERRANPGRGQLPDSVPSAVSLVVSCSVIAGNRSHAFTVVKNCLDGQVLSVAILRTCRLLFHKVLVLNWESNFAANASRSRNQVPRPGRLIAKTTASMSFDPGEFR